MEASGSRSEERVGQVRHRLKFRVYFVLVWGEHSRGMPPMIHELIRGSYGTCTAYAL